MTSARLTISTASDRWRALRFNSRLSGGAKTTLPKLMPTNIQHTHNESLTYCTSRQQSIKRFFVYKEGEAASSRLRDVLDSRHLGLGMIFGWPPKDGERCPFPG